MLNKKMLNLTVALLILFGMLLIPTSMVQAKNEEEPIKEEVERELVDFKTTTYTVQLGTFSEWDDTLERWKLANEQEWNPQIKYECINGEWYYKIWTLQTTNYKEAENEFNKLIETTEGKNLFDKEQLSIYEYLCPYVEIIYENYKGEKKSFDIEMRASSYMEEDKDLGNPTTVINKIEIKTNTGSNYVGDFLGYDVKFASYKPNYQFELIYPERFEQSRKTEIIKTETGLNEKWIFYLTDNMQETIVFQGKEIWIDDCDMYKRRPDSITVNLLANGTKVASKQVIASDDWKFCFENLPKYIDGKIIKYTISGETIKYYTNKVDGSFIVNVYDLTQENINDNNAETWDDKENETERYESVISEKVIEVKNKEDVVTSAEERNIPKTGDMQGSILLTSIIVMLFSAIGFAVIALNKKRFNKIND